MKQTLFILWIAVCGIIPVLSAQKIPSEKLTTSSRFLSNEWSFSVFNNAIAMPFSGQAGIVHTPLHPGFAVGCKHYWNKNPNHQIFQTFSLGGFYQQYVQTGIQLYSTFTYRFQMNFGLGIEAYAGVGYLHAFRDLQQFELNESSGQYARKRNFGQPRLMVPAGLALSYQIGHIRPFIGYGLWFQTPFSKEYIPILPNTALHIGVTLPL